jgi:hypothetical protein
MEGEKLKEEAREQIIDNSLSLNKILFLPYKPKKNSNFQVRWFKVQIFK